MFNKIPIYDWYYVLHITDRMDTFTLCSNLKAPG